MHEMIKYKRRQLGISQMHLGRKVGKSSTYINKIENGSGKPSVKMAVEIFNILNMNPMKVFKFYGVNEPDGGLSTDSISKSEYELILCIRNLSYENKHIISSLAYKLY